jgi:hypothetical protein
MKRRSKPDAALVGNVANNPRYDKVYSARNGMDAKAIKDSEDNIIYGSNEETKERGLKRLQEVYGSRKTASGNLARRDEPTEPQKTEYLKVDKKQFAKDLEFWKKRTQQSSARERLKKKNAVPTRANSGKKIFEDFCREAYKDRNRTIDDTDMRNIYNAANHLGYAEWVWFVSDEYGKQTKKVSALDD